MDSDNALTHLSPARIDGRIAAVTLDLHLGDSADDIRVACERLQARGIRATCIVPTVMLGDSVSQGSCSRLPGRAAPDPGSTS